ncbi:MAG: hypothetical protein NUV98_04960 [Candidatus Roizmanbacteria bacterium]|nr:hypothetical protein [Candidatus Roizmanbacteria bacterium]
MTITICASISFYKDVVDIKNQLVGKGFTVLMPHLAEVMERDNDFDRERQLAKRRKDNPKRHKTEAIMMHFNKIEKSDAILVVNKKKNGVAGYIGGNVLMEMGIAFYLGKKIYLLNPIPDVNWREEIVAMQPIIIEADISRILLR